MTALTEFQSSLSTALHSYAATSTNRTRLVDIYLAALVAFGVLQFLFAVLVGSFPFNAFLAGFIATVGQFVLTVSLKLQSHVVTASASSKSKASSSKSSVFDVSPERALGDYVFASVILHFIVWHFIN
jgi:oligosaccharyltransferase complex subunit epsilon